MRGAGIVTGFTLLSRVLGAARDLVIAHLFGAGLLTDAFIQAFTIPNVFRRLTAEGSMTLAFLPIYTEIREQQSVQAARIYASRVLSLVLLVTGLLTGLGMLFSPQLVWLFAAGFAEDPEKFALTSDLNRLMFPYLIMVSVVAWAMGILNAERRFAAPAAAPVLLNLAIIGCAWGVSPHLDQPIEGLAWGVLLGGLLQMLLQIPSLIRVGQPIQLRACWRDPAIRKLLLLLGPSLFGVAVYQINIIILRNLASFLPEGQVSYYYNASRLTELVLGVFAFAITTASFPELSRQQARTEWDGVQRTLQFSLHSTLFIVLPATAGLIGLAEPIVSMLYRHGAFAWEDVQATAVTLQAFALSIPLVAVVRLLVSLFFAFQDTSSPVKASSISLLLTAILGWWLSQDWQVVGLALALSIGALGQLIALLWLLRRHQFPIWQIWKVGMLLRYLFVSAGLGLGAWWGSYKHDWSVGPNSSTNWLLFLALIFSAGAGYFGILYLLRDPQLLALFKRIRRR